MDFKSVTKNNFIHDYFESDILEDFNYQIELEKHLDELENILIEPTITNQIDKKTSQTDTNVSEFQIENKLSETQNEKMSKLNNEKNEIPTKDEIKKKPIQKKYIKYNLKTNELNYLNTFSNNTYHKGTYLIDPKFKIKNKQNETDLEYVFNNQKIQLKNSNQIIQSNIDYYEIELNTDDFVDISEKRDMDFVAEINHLLNPLSTVLNYHSSKPELIYKNPNLIDCINKFIQQSGDHSTSLLTDLFAKFGETLAMLIKNEKLNIINFSNKTKYNNNHELWLNNQLKQEFKIESLPKELINIITHINYFFNEIKDKLKFNENTGFYNIIYNGSEYPLICKHVYLSLSGKSQYEISALCCVNSQCKFCGDSMVDYYYDDEDNIPTSIATLVYKLIDLSYGSNDDSLFRTVYIKCTSVILKFVNKNDEKYEDKATAIFSIFIFKIIKCLIQQNVISENSKKVNSLIKLIVDYCLIIGWDNQKIESLLDNDNLFTGISDFKELLFPSKKQTENEETMEFIFNEYADEELKKIKKDNKLNKFNDILLDMILDNVDYKKIESIIHTLQILSTIVNENTTIFHTEHNTEDLFIKLIRNYCPENFIHEWTSKQGTKICKYCGIDEHYKKISEIYEKYKNIFNNKYVLSSENKLNKFKIVQINKDEILKKLSTIKTSEIKNYIIKRLNISENEYKMIETNLFNIISYIYSSLLNLSNIHDEVINDLSETDLIKLYLYFDQTEPEKNLIEIFKYCLLKPSIYYKNKNSNNIYEDDDDD